nr:integrase, catalytic region, zinc finger, CCHC-type, peptidase aspartic, catalytic [Tanacetum cinerariifolium]
EVLKELPKVSMVNSCLKKLKFHLASFDMVVKERTTATAITERMWGFKHTKACFRDDIIPFVKALKELFTSFDQCLIDEVTEVQNVFKQMELAIEQHHEDKYKVQNKMENILQENDRLLTHTLSVEILNVVVHDNVKSACLNVDVCAHCVTIESELKNDFLKKECYETLLQKYHTLEKHCISLEVDNQLKNEIFQRNTLSSTEKKLRSLNGDVNVGNVKRELEEIETLNIELDHKVTKLVAENEHLKQTYKQLYDSIKSSRVRSKEQCDDLINKVNLKSAEVSDLNASLQEKFLVITALKEQLNKLKGKAVLTEAVSLNPIDPELLKVVQIVLWYLDSGCSNHMTGDRSQLVNFVQKFLGTVKFGNDHVAMIIGYGDYQIGNVTISRVYYMEGLGHNLFSVGQFCDSDLEGLVRGLLKLKYKKDHLCLACAMGKSTKKTYKPKFEYTDQEKLYLLHMDLCGLMHVESVNGKKYILVIVDDYSRFTWVKLLRSKDETLDFIKCPSPINDWDLLFQPMFDKLLNPPPSVVNQAPEVIAPIAAVIPPVYADLTDLPSSTTVDQDAPSLKHMGNNPLLGVPIPEVTSAQSSSTASPQSIVPVSTRLQLHEPTLFCYYDVFLTSVEPKMYKEALTQSCWIKAMQEELNEFERLEVWELVPRPDQVMVITLKWIYKVKLDELYHTPPRQNHEV